MPARHEVGLQPALSVVFDNENVRGDAAVTVGFGRAAQALEHDRPAGGQGGAELRLRDVHDAGELHRTAVFELNVIVRHGADGGRPDRHQTAALRVRGRSGQAAHQHCDAGTPQASRQITRNGHAQPQNEVSAKRPNAAGLRRGTSALLRKAAVSATRRGRVSSP
jgi:hypothetical protein